MSVEKQRQRRRYKQVRLAVAKRVVEKNSLTICRKIFDEVDWQNVKKICSYESITKLNEVDISPLLEILSQRHPGIKIKLLPRSKTQAVPQAKFDLIIVPCLAYDKDNYRLGWGGGFYDRFLAGQSRALKIGVCFKSGFVKAGLPHEPHDVRLDKVITEL